MQPIANRSARDVTGDASSTRPSGSEIRCFGCKALLNSYCSVDVKRNSWVCSLCGKVNKSGLEDVRLVELQTASPAVELRFHDSARKLSADKKDGSQLVMVVVDATLDQEDFNQLRGCILSFLKSLDPDTYVCIITFSAVVSVYYLTSKDVAEADIISIAPRKSSTPVNRTNSFKGSSGENGDEKSYIMHVDQCMNKVENIMDTINPYLAIYPDHMRPRCIISAIEVAQSIMNEANYTHNRIVVCTGGACTFGPGSRPADDHPEYYRLEREAKRYNEDLSKKLARQEIVVDIVGAGHCPIDVPKLYPLSQNTGGTLQIYEDFGAEYMACLNGLMRTRMGKNAIMDFHMSEYLEIEHIIGPVKSLALLDISNLQSNAIGLTTLNEDQGVAVMLEVKSDIPVSEVYFQAEVSYVTVKGEHVHQIFTTKMEVTNSGVDFLASIDPIAIGVMLMKTSLLKIRKAGYTTKTIRAVKKHIGEKLYQVCQQFSPRVDKSSMFKRSRYLVEGKLGVLAELLYHLQRSSALSEGGAHLDERMTMFSRLISAGVTMSSRMIWPYLIRVTSDGLEEGPAVDFSSQLYDTFALDCGTHIFVWIKDTVKDKDEVFMKYSVQLKGLSQGRFPRPEIFKCEEKSPNARYIQGKLIPLRRDSISDQVKQFPILGNVEGIEEYRAKLEVAFPCTDECTFKEWCHQLHLTSEYAFSTPRTWAQINSSASGTSPLKIV